MMSRFSRRVAGRGLWALVITTLLGMLLFRRRWSRRWAGAALLLCLTVGPASSQVIYERELSNTAGIGTDAYPLVAATQAPVPSVALYPQTITATEIYWTVDSASGLVSDPAQNPPNTKLDENSLIVMNVPSSDGPRLIYMNSNNAVATFGPISGFFVSHRLSALIRDLGSEAAVDYQHVTVVGDNRLYMINPTTGHATLVFDLTAELGTDNARYHTYGPNGMAYLLDYGNDKMDILDPSNGFSLSGSFSLSSSTIANEQFAIGLNGNLYLGDGLGGGSTYSANGAFLNTFALPGDFSGGDPYTGASYLSADSSGNVFVYDSGTGFHEFRDASVVPEPSTWALVITALFGMVLFRRRWSRRWAGAALLLCLTVGPASSQVIYERELGNTAGIGTDADPVIAATEAPVPSVALSPQAITTTVGFRTVDSASGLVSDITVLPPNTKLDGNSLIVMNVPSSPSINGPHFIYMNSNNAVVSYFTDSQAFVSRRLDAQFRDPASEAAVDDQHLTVVANNNLYTVNPSSGHATLVFDLTAELGTDNARYHTYGPNGMAYLLDYGNDKMDILDPSNGFSLSGSFSLSSSTIANEQFAIGLNGNLYLGDGLGGGSTYSANGTFLNTFALPGDFSGGDPYTGASYLSADSSGNVFVYDSGTGFHEFLDTSIVPEPSTWALMLLGTAGLGLLSRRKRLVSRPSWVLHFSE